MACAWAIALGGGAGAHRATHSRSCRGADGCERARFGVKVEG